MVVKTVIALLLTASLAGGAVYFGTQDDSGQSGEVLLGEHPHNDIENNEPNNEDSSSADNVIDRLINRSDDEEDTTINIKQDPVSDTEDSSDEIQLDAQIEAADEPEEVPANDSSAKVENKFVDLKDADQLVETVLREIKKIESVELRDQAYFDLVVYSLEKRMYSRASSGILSIENQSFRDSARGEYALAMINDGQVGAAFEMLDNVETEKLRGLLQLKAIRSMIGVADSK